MNIRLYSVLCCVSCRWLLVPHLSLRRPWSLRASPTGPQWPADDGRLTSRALPSEEE